MDLDLTFTVNADAATAEVTLDPAHKGKACVLSNGDLTVASTSKENAYTLVRSTTALDSGKIVVEIHIDASGAGAGGWAQGIGVGAASENLNAFLTASTAISGYSGPQAGYWAVGSTSKTGMPQWGADTTLQLAVDLDAKLMWLKSGPGTWNNSQSADPATGIGGNSWSTADAGPYFLYIHVGSITDQITVNFGDAPFVYTPPTGFVAWNGGVPSGGGGSNLITLSEPWQLYHSASNYNPPDDVYWLYINPWGMPGGYVWGTDCSESIIANPATFPAGSQAKTFWKDNPSNNGDLKSASGLGWGNYYKNPPLANNIAPKPIDAINTLTCTFDLSWVWDTKAVSCDVILDGYLVEDPANPTLDQEFSIFLVGGTIQPFLMTLPGRQSWVDPQGRAWYLAEHYGQKCAWLQDNSSLLSGTVDIRAFLQKFVALGWMTGTRYFTGLILAPEPDYGNTTLTYNSVSFVYN
jgi:hypothetical protein